MTFTLSQSDLTDLMGFGMVSVGSLRAVVYHVVEVGFAAVVAIEESAATVNGLNPVGTSLRAADGLNRVLAGGCARD